MRTLVYALAFTSGILAGVLGTIAALNGVGRDQEAVPSVQEVAPQGPRPET